MLNTPRKLTEKVDNMQKEMCDVSRKTLKDSKENDANKNHCNKNEYL